MRTINATTASDVVSYLHSPLGRAIVADLEHFNIDSRDATLFAVQLPNSVVDDPGLLHTLFAPSKGVETRKVITDACRQTVAYHFLMRDDLDASLCDLYARTGGTNGNELKLVEEIASYMFSSAGYMDEVVKGVFESNFDPDTLDKCPIADLTAFFWWTFHLKLDETGRVIL